MAKKKARRKKATTTARRKVARKPSRSTTPCGDGHVDELSALLLFDKAFAEHNLIKAKGKPSVPFLEQIAAGLSSLAGKKIGTTAAWKSWQTAFSKREEDPSDEEIRLGKQVFQLIELKLLFEEVQDAWEGRDLYCEEFVIALARSVEPVAGKVALSDCYRCWRRAATKMIALKKSMNLT